MTAVAAGFSPPSPLPPPSSQGRGARYPSTDPDSPREREGRTVDRTLFRFLFAACFGRGSSFMKVMSDVSVSPSLLSAHPEVYGGRRAIRPLVLDGPLLRAERDAAHLAEGDRHALAAHRRHAVLRHVGAVAVQHEDRADGERHADGRVEDAVLDDLDLFAEEDRLLG